ncbi:TolC family protein [Spirosoma sp. BT702]|uniref:TolC family protein n=1 Tax=Spirosoma profusum TaxID=2771354 RepID=A0A927AR44_9BACT|nr:TolC family protein [Spirosoma profusum]MBD2701696.1 TolC family protein [Spirosoma profusum]
MKRVFIGLFLLLSRSPAFCQTPADTLRLTLPQAEDQFRQHNLSLLATRLGINEYQGYENQSKQRNNPSIYIEQMPYNRQTREFMPVKQGNSEQLIQVQQLLLLAGKRNKQLALATTNTKLAADRFDDLVRTLSSQLRSTFYDLYYQQKALAIYEQEINTLSQTVGLYQQQYDKGNVPLKDLTRLKAYLFNLSTERQQRQAQVTDDQTTLAVLLNTAPEQPINATLTDAEVNQQRDLGRLSLDSLITLAERNRPDLRGYRDQTIAERQNLSLQKAMAVPDLTLQGTYDRNAGYIPNYFGVGVGISLPFFNRNQGNIQAANVRIQSSQQVASAYQLQVEGELQRSLTKARQADQLYRTFDQRFNSDFGRLIDGVTLNYRKQNIDVVEFLDFLDSYKTSQIQFIQLQNDRTQRLEDLRLAVGANPFAN